MDHQSPRAAQRIQLHWPLISGVGSLLLGSLLGVIVLVRGNTPLEADAEWMEEILESRGPVLDVPSYALDLIGSGWATAAITIVIGVVLLVLRRPWAALFLASAVIVSSLVVQGLKALFGRLRPDEILLSLDSG
jgi:hypothetical protein